MTTFSETVSDANRAQLAYIEETTFGSQVTGSNLQTMRLTGESLKGTQETQVSNELRSDRQISDIVRTGLGMSGGVNAEMSYGAYDDLILAGLMASAWSSPVTVGPITTIDASDTDNSFNDSANGFGSLVVGQWVKVSGFTTAANNGIFKLTSVAAGKIIVSGGTLVTEAVGDSVTIVMGAQAVNGTTKISFNIERKYTDLSNEFALFTGCMVNGFGLSVALKNMVTASFDFAGKKEESETASGGTGYDLSLIHISEPTRPY